MAQWHALPWRHAAEIMDAATHRARASSAGKNAPRRIPRSVGAPLLLGLAFALQPPAPFAAVNDPAVYPANPTPLTVVCAVDGAARLSDISPWIYGTNLEWFNQAGGLVDEAGNLEPTLQLYGAAGKVPLYRFPGGTLSDYYHWGDGTGPQT